MWHHLGKARDSRRTPSRVSRPGPAGCPTPRWCSTQTGRSRPPRGQSCPPRRCWRGCAEGQSVMVNISLIQNGLWWYWWSVTQKMHFLLKLHVNRTVMLKNSTLPSNLINFYFFFCLKFLELILLWSDDNYLEPIKRPRAKFEPTRLLVKREVAHVDITRRLTGNYWWEICNYNYYSPHLEYSRRLPLDQTVGE